MGQEKINHVIAPTPDQITLEMTPERPTKYASASPRGRQKQFDNDRKGIAGSSPGSPHCSQNASSSRQPAPITEHWKWRSARPHCQASKSTHCKCDASPRQPEHAPKPTRSTPPCSPNSVVPCSRISRQPGMKPLIVLPNCWPLGALGERPDRSAQSLQDPDTGGADAPKPATSQTNRNPDRRHRPNFAPFFD